MGCKTALILMLALAAQTQAAERSRQAVAEFKRAHPCPATGKPRGACPGWIVDHITPMCAGGPDNRDNMQWQTVAEAKLKDRAERAQCRRR